MENIVVKIKQNNAQQLEVVRQWMEWKGYKSFEPWNSHRVKRGNFDSVYGCNGGAYVIRKEGDMPLIFHEIPYSEIEAEINGKPVTEDKPNFREIVIAEIGIEATRKKFPEWFLDEPIKADEDLVLGLRRFNELSGLGWFLSTDFNWKITTDSEGVQVLQKFNKL